MLTLLVKFPGFREPVVVEKLIQTRKLVIADSRKSTEQQSNVKDEWLPGVQRPWFHCPEFDQQMTSAFE